MSNAFLHDLLASIAERGRTLLTLERPHAPGERDLHRLAEALLSGEGEASGVALAAQLNAVIGALDGRALAAFFSELARDFGPDRERLSRAVAAYQQDASAQAAMELHAAAEPRRQELFRRLNLAPGGTAALVAVRAELLDLIEDHPELKQVDSDFAHLFSSWFNRGFLVMRRIDWNTPAAVLEKIIRYEAVHAIDDWDDLRRRIDPPDRRCYGFFHPALIDEPLIFVEVALTGEMPAAIGPILANERTPILPGAADTAVFYSISNCQKGLRGVSFGSFLIKQVVEELRRELPGLKAFVTLSPVPGFRRWLGRGLRMHEIDFLETEDLAAIEALTSADWAGGREGLEPLKPALLALAAHYFLNAKANGKPPDPVARFHLGNGARLERINWLADPSERGLKQGAGLMVNYLYVLKDIEKNHELYANEGKIAASPQVTKLLKSKG